MGGVVAPYPGHVGLGPVDGVEPVAPPHQHPHINGLEEDAPEIVKIGKLLKKSLIYTIGKGIPED